MYGPAVRRKRFRRSVGVAVLHQSGPLLGAACAPGHHGYGAFSLADRPRTGHLGHHGSHAPGRPVLHLVSSSRRPRRVRSLGFTSSRAHWAAAGIFLASKFRPRARTLQAMRASLLASAMASTLWCSLLLGRLEPGLEPAALPALWLDQHNPRRLDEQDAQVAIATLRYLAENGAIPSRDLLGDEPQPSGEVAAFGERIPIANRTKPMRRCSPPFFRWPAYLPRSSSSLRSRGSTTTSQQCGEGRALSRRNDRAADFTSDNIQSSEPKRSQAMRTHGRNTRA